MIIKNFHFLLLQIFFLDENDGTPQTIKVRFLDPKFISDLIFVVHLYSHQRFGPPGNVNGPWASEYIGSSVAILGQDVPNHLKDKILQVNGTDIHIDLTFYQDCHGDNYKKFLDVNLIESLIRVKSCPEMLVDLTAKSNNGKAIADVSSNVIFPMWFPKNISPDYSTSSLFIWINTIDQHAKLKRTRIVVKILNKSTKKFLPVFNRAQDSNSFATLVQKGKRQIVDEIIHIDLSRFDPVNTVIIFEVQRISRKKGTVRLSTIGVLNIVLPYGTIINQDPSRNDPQIVYLFKPTREEMLIDDYLAFLSKKNDNSSGQIQLFTILVSTSLTFDRVIYSFIHWDDKKAEVEKRSPDDLDEVVEVFPAIIQTVFLHVILDRLAYLMEFGRKDFKEKAVYVFVKIFRKN